MELILAVVALALTVVGNVLALGFIYGKVVTQLKSLTEELRAYAYRTDRSVDRHDATLIDHGQRIARLEATRMGVNA